MKELAMADVMHLDGGNFEDVSKQGIVLVDFWAPWCGPCRMLGPVLDELAAEIGDKAVISKVNCDESPEIASNFGVSSIPAIFILKEGEVAKQFVGVQSKGDLAAAIDELV